MSTNSNRTSKKPADKSNLSQTVRHVGIVSSIPFFLVAGPVAGYYLSEWIEIRFGSFPGMRLFIIGLFVIVAVREVHKLIRQVMND